MPIRSLAQQIFALAALAALAAGLGCVAAKPADTATPTGQLQVSAAPTTLAILPFENNSITDPKMYDPLAAGLAAMLITDLQQAGTSLRVIERAKIAALLKEIAMGQAGALDSATAVRAGKLLGAQSIAFGSFTVMGGDVRMDVRIVKTETSENILGASIMGSKSDFMKLERDLAVKIASALKTTLAPPPSGPAARSGMDAALLYSRGLEALDKGNRPEAERLFAETVAADPAYKRQVDGVLGALK